MLEGAAGEYEVCTYVPVHALVKGYDLCTYLLTHTAHVLEQDDFH
jgi:hypothetical protein